MNSSNKIALKTLGKAMLIIFLFAVMTISIFISKQDHSFASLKEAVSKTTKGGLIDATYELKGGTFVFVKGSPSKEFGYYYKKNDRWYHRTSIIYTQYDIDEDYTIYTYYVVKPKYYFIRVQANRKDIEEVEDSYKTEFKKNSILVNNNLEDVYVGGFSKELSKSYVITINKEDYILNNYYQNQKLLQ